MIPAEGETARIHITATLKCLGYTAAQVQGYLYSLEDRPFPDVVTFAPDDGPEIEMAGPYGTPVEDAIRSALFQEAMTDANLSRLEEAFIEWRNGKREAARERAQHLRMVG